jgi:site-specific recombinase
MNSVWRIACGLLLSVCVCSAQSFLNELKAEHDPARRAEKALEYADESFDSARAFYDKGLVHKGDEQLDYMTAALKECVDALDQAHKAKFYKKAELNVAVLQRRMDDLLSDLSIQERGWAEYINRKLDEMHDKILEGVMRK